ncbi:MAG: hypothetical protein CVU56_01060 [Deltaproteobacteria bacterium HGW-Deltaproteobacteria-14]|nr:MAG: hypothetical protein CVU56_01060 [Deltaproteobacteria bacterium HGW-Deltaproteobacteria-14]
MTQRNLLAVPTLFLLSTCAPAVAPPVGSQVEIAVAALNLPGVTNARYNLRVENASQEVVVDVDLTADAYGDGAGAVAYVAPCDADDNDNTVFITLLALYEGAGIPIAGDTYRNPGELSRTVTCAPNADVRVDFDLTIARDATQGFFDVAIEFDQVFCSAKLDCESSPGQPLRLLDHAGTRDTTVVVGFSCTGDISGADTTVQYLDDVVVSCSGGAVAVDPTSGPGNVDLGDAAQASVTGANPLFAAAVYRGTERLGFDKQYWNVALGLDGLANCTLTTRGTASSGEFSDGRTPPDAVWPFIFWNVILTDGSGGLACTTHPVDDTTCPATGVCTDYTPNDDPRQFAHSFDGAGAASLAPLGSATNPGASCLAVLDSGDGVDDGAYWIDPDGAGVGIDPFQVYCDQTTDHGGWAYVAAMGESAVPAAADVMTDDRNAALLLSGAPLTGSDYATLGLARFEGWGENWTLRATVAAGTSELQLSYWRPALASGPVTTTADAGEDWAITSPHTDLLHLTKTNTLGAANTSWLSVPGCSACGGMWVFAYRVTPIDGGAQCLTSAGDTSIAHFPPGAWQSVQPGTDTCAFGMQDGVVHSWSKRGGWWIKDVNVAGAP